MSDHAEDVATLRAAIQYIKLGWAQRYFACDPGRTKAEVLDLFARAIALAKSQGTATGGT